MSSIYDDDSDDIDPIEKSNDRATVIIPIKPGRPYEELRRSEVVKEMIIEDAETIGHKEAALLHDVGSSTISKWKKEKDEPPKITKQEIEELAASKLMQTLLLLDPEMVDKERDRVTIINGLSQVIERVGDPKKEKEGNKVLHLHLYDPGRKKESDYEIIDV